MGNPNESRGAIGPRPESNPFGGNARPRLARWRDVPYRFGMPGRMVVGRALRALSISVLSAVTTTTALAQRQAAPSGVKVGMEIVTGTVVAPLVFIGGGVTTKWIARRLGATERVESRSAYVGAWTMTGLVTAAVPPLLVHGGNYPAALAGTAIGGAAAAAMVWAGRSMFREAEHCGVVCTVWGVAAFALPATGATLLYHRSR